ncbi:MAG TPA: hypothetical protein VKB78_06515, partial [Pirellulales bacterium]|nr:hypothetical protein [Pirellulales bacterium]
LAFARFSLGIVALAVAMTMILGTLGSAMVPAIQAVRRQRNLRERRVRAFCLITALHIMQPLARAWGHIVGWWMTRGSRQYPADERIYGNLIQREAWLERLERHLGDCGWTARPSSAWDTADLDILGPGPYRLQLCSVYEDDVEHGRHFVRFRVTARAKRWLPVVWLAVVATAAAFVVAPTLLPLAAPLGVFAWALARSKQSMQSAVSQLATECAEPLGMIKADLG